MAGSAARGYYPYPHRTAHQPTSTGKTVPVRTGTTEPSRAPGPRPMLRRMELTPARRRVLSTVLALVLAIESVSAVAAAAQVGGEADPPPPALAPPSAVVAPAATAVDAAARPRGSRSSTPWPASPSRDPRHRSPRPSPRRPPIPPRPLDEPGKADKGDKHRSGDARSGVREAGPGDAQAGSRDAKHRARTSTHRSSRAGAVVLGAEPRLDPVAGHQQVGRVVRLQPLARARQLRLSLGLRRHATTSTCWATRGACSSRSTTRTSGAGCGAA